MQQKTNGVATKASGCMALSIPEQIALKTVGSTNKTENKKYCRALEHTLSLSSFIEEILLAAA